jgi:hypothetical protein
MARSAWTPKLIVMARRRKQSVQVGGGTPALIGRSMFRPAADAGRQVAERVRDALKKFKRDGGDSEIRSERSASWFRITPRSHSSIGVPPQRMERSEGGAVDPR